MSFGIRLRYTVISKKARERVVHGARTDIYRQDIYAFTIEMVAGIALEL